NEFPDPDAAVILHAGRNALVVAYPLDLVHQGSEDRRTCEDLASIESLTCQLLAHGAKVRVDRADLRRVRGPVAFDRVSLGRTELDHEVVDDRTGSIGDRE